MKKYIPHFVAALAVVFAADWAGAYSTLDSNRATRACIPDAGESEQLSVSSNASTAELDTFTVYGFVCTVAVYWEMGDSAAATADSSSNYLPADTMLFFLSGGKNQSAYLSAVDIAAAAGTCYVTKCE